MGIAVRARQLGLPYPFDATFLLGTQKWNAMLVPQPYDVLAEQLKGLAGVVPTSYSGSSLDPTIEGVRIFRHWIDGLGERHRQADDSHLYQIANDVDASCGGNAFLGPEILSVTPSGANSSSFEKLYEYPSASGVGTPRLLAAQGSQLLEASAGAGDPGIAGSWQVKRDFTVTPPVAGLTVTPSTAPAPVISSVNVVGTNNGKYWKYKVQARDAAGNALSAVSTEISSGAVGPTDINFTALGVGDYLTISWSAIGGAVYYDVYLTDFSPGNTIGGVAAVAGFLASTSATAYLHTSANGVAPFTPPASSTGNKTWKYKVVAVDPVYPTAVHSAASAEFQTSAGSDSLGTGFSNAISWTAVPGASGYQIYRTSSGGTPATLGIIGTTTGAGFTDTGQGGDGSTAPGSDAQQTITDVFVHPYGGIYYLLVGMNVGGYWYFDGSTWTQHNLRGTHFTNNLGRLYRAGPSSRQITAAAHGTYGYGNEIACGLFSTLSPPTLSASWTEVANNADWDQPVTNLFGIGSTVLVFTRNRIYISAGADITPMQVEPDDENGRSAFIFDSDIYAPFGEEWWKITITSSTTANIVSTGLGRFVENTTNIKGPVVAGVAHNNWFAYFVIWNGTDSYLMKLGSWANPGETSTHLWEFRNQIHGSIGHISNRQVRSAVISEISGTGTLSNPRLFLGLDNGTLRVIVLPLKTPSPLADTNCRFVASGSLTLGIDDAGFGANDKSYHRAALLGEDLTDDTYAILSYALDGRDVFNEFSGRFTSNGASLTFPEEAQGKLIQPKVSLYSDANTETPQVNTLLLFAQVREFTDEDGNPAFRRKRRIYISCEDWTVLNDGTSDKVQNARRLREGMQQIAAAPSCSLYLRDGVKRTISVLAWSEGLVIGPGGQERYAITLDYLESALATGPDASGPPDPQWGP